MVVHWLYISIIRLSITFASLVWWPCCQMASAKKKTKPSSKTSMLSVNGNNVHYSHQCCGSTYLPPPTGASGIEWGEFSCPSSLESGSQGLRDEFHWDTFDHPPYSPVLAPSDFHLFLKMKEHLAGKRHADDEDLQHAVVDWLNSQAALWYEEGISKLVSQYEKCLNVQGDCVEK